MPNNKMNEISWVRFNSAYGSMLKYQLSPAKVVVHGDMAIAHYYYALVRENKEGKRQSDNGRWSDVLVREGKSWKFIGWQGGSESAAVC